ncbi:MAG: FAD-dependent oxidoreductase [candidate division Zixibacteria bacterium]
MPDLKINIDGQSISCASGITILEAADGAGIYIPRLCHHPDISPSDEVKWSEAVYQTNTKIPSENTGESAGENGHCNLCLIEIEGQPEPVNSCVTEVVDGMSVSTLSEKVIKKRRDTLSKILSDHPHACLTCAQKEGCSLTDCSSNVPVNERCCPLLGHCELEKISDHIGIPGETPKYIPQNRPISSDEPFFIRDYNLCVGCLRCVRICDDIHRADILGAVWKDDRAWIGFTDGNDSDKNLCRYCGACIEICPTGALRDKEGATPVRAGAALPCVSACPAGIDIPRYLHLIAKGDYRKALEVICARVPFPGILGYVCFHPCESGCRRSKIDKPVAICDLKRFAADKVGHLDFLMSNKKVDTGKKTAIIGSGPAGLTAAYYLMMQGHTVEIFEKENQAGGMLRHGIPDYRLPQDILDRELKTIEKLGITIHLNHEFGDATGIDRLKSDGYDAILIAAGVSASKNLNIENLNLNGIYSALDFLKSAKLSREPKLTGKVIVIGGGNVGIDAAMTANRLGADEVTLVCLESRIEMPAHDWEIEQAEQEGITIENSWGPRKFISDGDKLTGVEFIRCTRVFDEQKRFNPQYDENKNKEIVADAVIVAIGQGVDEKLNSYFNDKLGINIAQVTDSQLSENIFVAGDIVRGPTSVIDAIAEGRKAADLIDIFLEGDGIIETDFNNSEYEYSRIEIPHEDFQHSRISVESVNSKQRKNNFDLITSTMDEKQACLESRRCLQCYQRQNITPATLPPEPWLPLNQKSIEDISNTEGVIRLLDENKKVIRISGVTNLRDSLGKCLDNPGEAKWFIWEEDPMYTKRESELIQQYLQEHGEMPGGGGGNDDLDDLF